MFGHFREIYIKIFLIYNFIDRGLYVEMSTSRAWASAGPGPACLEAGPERLFVSEAESLGPEHFQLGPKGPALKPGYRA